MAVVPKHAALIYAKTLVYAKSDPFAWNEQQIYIAQQQMTY